MFLGPISTIIEGAEDTKALGHLVSYRVAAPGPLGSNINELHHTLWSRFWKGCHNFRSRGRGRSPAAREQVGSHEPGWGGRDRVTRPEVTFQTLPGLVG